MQFSNFEVSRAPSLAGRSARLGEGMAWYQAFSHQDWGAFTGHVIVFIVLIIERYGIGSPHQRCEA